MIVARRCYVSGRVQGVFFRASTRQKAIELGCAGYARNLPDGRVEVLALGEPHALDQLIQWLWKGPPAAQVSNVEVIELSMDEFDDAPVGFGTR